MAKNDKAQYFYVLYSNKTWVFDQSGHLQSPIYIINCDKTWAFEQSEHVQDTDWTLLSQQSIYSQLIVSILEVLQIFGVLYFKFSRWCLIRTLVVLSPFNMITYSITVMLTYSHLHSFFVLRLDLTIVGLSWS